MRLPWFTWCGIEIPVRSLRWQAVSPHVERYWPNREGCMGDAPVCVDEDDERRHECDSVELSWCDTLWIHGWREATSWEMCTSKPGRWVVYEPSRNPDDFGVWKAIAVACVQARMMRCVK